MNLFESFKQLLFQSRTIITDGKVVILPFKGNANDGNGVRFLSSPT
jgi:hypothetical protein